MEISILKTKIVNQQWQWNLAPHVTSLSEWVSKCSIILLFPAISIVVFLKYINIKLTLRLPCRDISNVLYFKSNCNVHHITRVVLRLGTWDWIVQIFLWKRALSDKLLFCLISSSFQMHLFTFWSSTNVSFVRINVNWGWEPYASREAHRYLGPNEHCGRLWTLKKSQLKESEY